MKTLDKYIIKNFITGYIIAFFVLIGLCVVIDLFVNLDEFAENVDNLGTWGVFTNMLSFYGARSALYFRDFAGMITVIAAVFSLGKMTRSNELVAVMASGVSLKRVILPIMIVAGIFTIFYIIDQEILIPNLTSQLIRSHDSLPGQEQYDIWYMLDGNGALINTQAYKENTRTMEYPYIIVQREKENGKWEIAGIITADSATYNETAKGWDLKNGKYMETPATTEEIVISRKPPQPLSFFKTDITDTDIPMRRQEGYKSLLSSAQLAAIYKQRGTATKDLAELLQQRHSRVTDPIINLVMLLIALPVLVCRDPKDMKSAILKSFGLTTLAFLITFVCKMFATEVFFNQVRPEFWAWIPIFIFLPAAFVELDSMRT